MDYELATAVIGRYQSGLAVDEAVFFKAAHAVGADPYDALLEARFATMLSFDTEKMASGERLSAGSIAAYSAAVGEDPRVMHKVASSYGLDPERLVMLKLAEQNWVPNLEMLKVAMMAEGGGMGAEQMQAPMADPAAAGGGAAQPPMPPPEGMGPQPGAAVQQRYKPSPMAPMQTPPSPEGNLQELSEAARHPDAAADAMAAQQQPGGSMGPEGAPDSMGPDAGPGMAQEAPPPPPPMPPEEKLQQADPSIPPENMPRYAEKLTEIEQETGIPMQDPAQVKKFVAQMQKDDAKVLDEAIKGMSTDKPFSPSGGEPAPDQEKVAMRRAYLP